jgi:hypothetical protein
MPWPDVVLFLAAIREREQKATPGPWERHGYNNLAVRGPDDDEGYRQDVLATDALFESRHAADDAEFIVHARSDIPALLAAIEEQARELEAMHLVIEALRVDIREGRDSHTARAYFEQSQPALRAFDARAALAGGNQ